MTIERTVKQLHLLALLPLGLLACASPNTAPATPGPDAITPPAPTVTLAVPTRTPLAGHPEALTAQAEARVRLTQTAAATTPTATFTTLPPTLIVDAQEIRIPSISPDREWIAFWIPVEGESEVGISYTALTFYHVADGEMCVHEDIAGLVQYEIPDTYHFWLPDGRVVAILTHQPYIGLPCQEFEPAAAFWGEAQTAFSPSGRYRATTTHDGKNATTVIADMTSGAVMNQVEWTHRGGQMVCCVGGRWMSDDLFMINWSLDRGPLMVRVGGEVIEVVPTLFGMKPSALAEQPDVAYGAVDEAGAAYHILLERRSAAEGAPFLLFHSHTGEVESLSYRGIWGAGDGADYRGGFSPDGGWLLLQLPLNEQRQDYSLHFVRPVDGPADAARLLAQFTGSAQWSPDGDLLAFDELDGIVRVMTFPEGEIIEYWSHPAYRLWPVGWLDEDRLLLFGDTIDQNPWTQALFVAER